MAAPNYIRLYEFIFDRVFDPVESIDLLLELEIPPAEPGTFLAAYREDDVKVVARFVGGHLNQLLLLRVSIVLKADFIAIRTNAAFLSWWSFTLKTLVSYNFCSINSNISSRCSVAMLILSFFSAAESTCYCSFFHLHPVAGNIGSRHWTVSYFSWSLKCEPLHLRKISVGKWVWKE